MSLTDKALSRAHRSLRHLSRYQSLNADRLIDVGLTNADLEIAEIPVGIYDNSSDDLEQSIIFTSSGIYIRTVVAKTYINYAMMANVNALDDAGNETVTANALNISMKDGTSLAIPIIGRSGRFHDVWTILHYLMRVIELVNKPAI
jgi:hypothetical protein